MHDRTKVTTKKPDIKKSKPVQAWKGDFNSPISSAVDHILFLQRTIGNQAVQRLFKSGVIQAKLKIGQPGDIYEQEADRVAEQVVLMPEPGLQRQAEEEKEEEELIQTKPLAEQITPLVRRQVEPEEEEVLQAKQLARQTPEVAADLESRINAIRGGGQPLPESVRAFFEPRFGRDLEEVRIHTSGNAEKTVRALNALAYTTAHDIVFRQGAYQPNRASGRRLLAHELTHVLQQTRDQRVENSITKVVSDYKTIQKRPDYTNPHESIERKETYTEEIITPIEKIIIGAIDELVDMIAEKAVSPYKYAKIADRLAKAFGKGLEGSLRHSRQRLIKSYGEITAESIIKTDQEGRVIDAAGEEGRIRRMDYVTDWQDNKVKTIIPDVKKALRSMSTELKEIIIEEIADIALGKTLERIGNKIGDFIGDFLTGDCGIVPEDFISQRFENIVQKSVGAVSTAFAKSVVEYSLGGGIKETEVMGLVIEKFPEAIGPSEASKLFSEKAQLEWVLKSFGDKEEKVRTLLDENERRNASRLYASLVRLIQMYNKGADEEMQKREARKIISKLGFLEGDILIKSD